MNMKDYTNNNNVDETVSKLCFAADAIIDKAGTKMTVTGDVNAACRLFEDVGKEHGCSQSRRYFITLNFKNADVIAHDQIADILVQSNPRYFCMADEIAATGTHHTHVYVIFSSPVRFETLKKRFPQAHIQAAHGNHAQIIAYISKGGKWENSEKAETRVENTFDEWGENPLLQSNASNNIDRLFELIYAGATNAEIICELKQFAFRSQQIESIRAALTEKEYGSKMRDLHVTYMSGATGSGKTRGIFERHRAEDICRITTYRAGKGVYFDEYRRQPVLVFEEFAGQIPIEEMLNYLDRYPVRLPARYSDRQAAYTTVYLTSNLPLEMQYLDAQLNKPETWRAFLRRINAVVTYKADGTSEMRTADTWTEVQDHEDN